MRGPPVTRPSYRPFGALRFGLALMVLAQHGLLLLPEAGRQVFYRLELGAVAVGAFFALSGAVGAEAISKVYAARPGAFLVNRFLRIVPLYAVALVLTLGAASMAYARGGVVTLDAPLDGPPWRGSVLLSGLLEILPGVPGRRISGQGFSFIPFAWTLRTEMLFYLLAAGWCAWPFRRPGGAVLLASGYALFGLFVAFSGMLPQQMLCVPFFVLGIQVFAWRPQSPRDALALCLSLCCAAYGFTFWAQRGHPLPGFQLPLLLTLLIAIQLLAHAGSIGGAVKRWDRRLGDLSYPLYVSHGAVLLSLLNATAYRGWKLYGAGVLLALALAVLLHLCVDLPLRRVRTTIRGTEV